MLTIAAHTKACSTGQIGGSRSGNYTQRKFMTSLICLADQGLGSPVQIEGEATCIVATDEGGGGLTKPGQIFTLSPCTAFAWHHSFLKL